jgi:hypothetical protein
MALLMEVLWALMLLLFLAGAVTYAFQPQVGRSLLKRSIILLAAILIGPSLIHSAFDQIPGPLLAVLLVAASLIAYAILSHSSKAAKHHHGSGVSHAERQPHVPGNEEEEESPGC